MTTTLSSIISGDVIVEKTRLNTKGGSMTATLRRDLREAFEKSGNMAVGARLDFDKQRSLVILAPSSYEAEHGEKRIQVTRLHEHRFVVDLVDDTTVETDPLTQAFLTMIIEQFKNGERTILDQETAFAELDKITSGSDSKPLK